MSKRDGFIRFWRLCFSRSRHASGKFYVTGLYWIWGNGTMKRLVEWKS